MLRAGKHILLSNFFLSFQAIYAMQIYISMITLKWDSNFNDTQMLNNMTVLSFPDILSIWVYTLILYRVRGPQKNGTVDFSGLCSDQQLSFFTLLDRTSFPHYNNTKIIKFGWELFILWVISYGLSFSGFAQFPEFRGTINDSFGRP